MEQKVEKQNVDKLNMYNAMGKKRIAMNKRWEENVAEEDLSLGK